MKLLVIAVLLVFANQAHADSIWVKGAQADAIVNPIINVGMSPIFTHEYMQAGVVGCSKLFDDRGDYFPNGKIGDYVGERCKFYGSFVESDGDGLWEPEALIPQDDRDLAKHAELRANIEKFRAVREALEVLVTPIVRTMKVNDQDVVIAQTSGIGGIACDGRDDQGRRVCQILISPKFPARHP